MGHLKKHKELENIMRIGIKNSDIGYTPPLLEIKIIISPTLLSKLQNKWRRWRQHKLSRYNCMMYAYRQRKIHLHAMSLDELIATMKASHIL